jgi:outer membrane protein TolC
MLNSSALIFILLVVIFPAGPVVAAESGPGPEASEIWTARQAVAVALRNNPDSSMAWQRLEAANAALRQEQAAFYPQLSLYSRYSQTDNPMYSFGNILNQGAFTQNIDFNDPGRTDDLNLGVKLSYRFYNGGRDQAGVEAAGARENATRMELGAVRNQLAFAAVRAFNLIIQEEEVVRARQAAVAAIDASLGVARARYGEGVLLKADLLNLEVQQSRSRENLIQAENSLEISRRVLLNLLGFEHGRVVVAPGAAEAQEVPPDRSFAQRYELRSAAAMVRAAEARQRQARGAGHPTLDGFAGYEHDRGWETDGSGNSWQAGILLNYNLFDGHRTVAGVSEAAARLAEAGERQRQLELAIGLEVTRAELALKESETRLKVSEKAVEQARESARIYRARFKEGEVLAADLIGVENELTDAILRRTLAETARRIAIADLRRALGLPQFPDLAEELAGERLGVN